MRAPSPANRCRRGLASLALAAACVTLAAAQSGVPGRALERGPDRARVLDAMKRATVFMVETVSTRGGYVWQYLPDFSRRWGDLEARLPVRALYREAKAVPPAEAVKESPLAPGDGMTTLPRYVAVREPPPFLAGIDGPAEGRAARIIASLDAQGRWLTELWQTSHPYRGDGPAEVAPGDFRRTSVGDGSDTSPYRAAGVIGISTQAYIRNLSELIRYLDSGR